MLKLTAAAASAALIAAAGLAFAQESAPTAPQAPAVQQDQTGCPEPGTVPEAQLPANCKMTNTTEQPKTDSGTAGTVTDPDGTAAQDQTTPTQDGTTAQDGSAATDDGTTATTTVDPAQPPAAATADRLPDPGNAFLASRLIGQTVYSSANENIGEVNDLIVGRDPQGVIFAVIGVGGFLGIGEKDVAVPMDSLQITADPNSSNMKLVVNMSKQQLEASPTFDRTAALGG